jgi:hypothetical protein
MFSLCLIKHHGIRIYEGEKESLHRFFNSATDKGSGQLQALIALLQYPRAKRLVIVAKVISVPLTGIKTRSSSK